MARSGHVVHVLEAIGDDPPGRGLVTCARLTGQAGHRVTVLAERCGAATALRRARAELIEQPLASRQARRHLAERIAALDCDILHAHSAPAAATAQSVARALGLPLVLSLNAPLELGGFRNRRNAAAAQASIVLAVSDGVARGLRDSGAVAPERIRLLRPPYDAEQFSQASVPGARVVALAERWRLSDAQAVLLVPADAALLRGPRPLWDVLQAFAGSELRCLVAALDVAEPEELRGVEESARQAGLGHLVHVLPRVDDWPAVYKLADVVLRLGRSAWAHDMITAEAQAMGRPVVSTLEGSRELIVEQVTGRLVPDGDPGAAAEALHGFLGLDGEAREALAARAVDNIARLADPARFLAGLLNAYDDVLSGRVA
ncbi:MAG: glycosyltransferase [Azospirillaceae bacterium]